MANRWTTRQMTQAERNADARSERFRNITRGIYQLGNNWRRDIANRNPSQRYTQPKTSGNGNSPI